MRQPKRPHGLIDIMDLPPVGASGSLKPRFMDANVRQAVAIEDVPSANSRSRSCQLQTDAIRASSGRSLYGHDPQYKWLRGKLEYSEREGRWKLRYIPIDGETDNFGGSVVLPDVSSLSNHERGDFVELHGKIGRGADEKPEFAPGFQISRVQPLGR